MKKHSGDYGARPDDGLFGPSGLLFFAWFRRPLTLVLVHFAALATPVWLALSDLPACAWWLLLLAAILVAGYWFDVAQDKELARLRWRVQLLLQVMHPTWGKDRSRWPANAQDQYRAATTIIDRYTWLHSKLALGFISGPDTIRMQWRNASGDTVCLLMGRSIQWWLAYGDSLDNAIPDDHGHWDHEFAPPRPLYQALMLVAP